MNRELGSDLDLEQIRHVAVWNPERQRIETSARFLTAQEIRVEPAGKTFEIAAGEEIHIEISRKFEISALREDLARFGFDVTAVFTDDRDWYALLLLERASSPS